MEDDLDDIIYKHMMVARK